METKPIIDIVYLVAAVLFIFGLKSMAHPRTAVRGNLLGAAGMLLAIIVALISPSSYTYIVLGILLGGGIGAVLAIRIQMTDMPQLVALFNGFGGLASVFVAGGALVAAYLKGGPLTWDVAAGNVCLGTYRSGNVLRQPRGVWQVAGAAIPEEAHCHSSSASRECRLGRSRFDSRSVCGDGPYLGLHPTHLDGPRLGLHAGQPDWRSGHAGRDRSA